MLAAYNGHTNVVETLLQHGAYVDMQNEVSAGSQTASRLCVQEWYMYLQITCMLEESFTKAIEIKLCHNNVYTNLHYSFC